MFASFFHFQFPSSEGNNEAVIVKNYFAKTFTTSVCADIYIYEECVNVTEIH